MLVSADDPTEYCNGEYKLTAKKKSSFEKHVKAYRYGTTVVMKAVSLVEDAKHAIQQLQRSGHRQHDNTVNGLRGQQCCAACA